MRLRLGSRSASCGRLLAPLPPRLPAVARGVRPRFCHSGGCADSGLSGASGFPGTEAAGRGFARGQGGAGPVRVAPQLGLPASLGRLSLAHTGAQLQTQKGRSQLLGLMYCTDRNFPESAAFTHRRLHRPFHVPLPLPSSRAFSKDSTQWVVGSPGGRGGCHGDRTAARTPLAQTGRVAPPPPPPSLQRPHHTGNEE